MSQPSPHAFLPRVDEIKDCATQSKKLRCDDDAHCENTPAGPAANSSHQLSKAGGACHPLTLPMKTGGLSMHQVAAAMMHDCALQERLVKTLGQILDTTVYRNDARRHRACCSPDSPLLRFESNSRCPLKPSAYLERIQKYTVTSPCNFVIGLIYLQRLRDLDQAKQMRLTSFNTQRYLLTAIMLASKTFDDYYVSNKQWALVGDLDVKEMNTLELDMLFALSFSMGVTREEYDLCSWALDDHLRTLAGEEAMQFTNVVGEKATQSTSDISEMSQTCVDSQPDGPLSRKSSFSHSPEQTVHDGPQGMKAYDHLKSQKTLVLSRLRALTKALLREEWNEKM